VIARVALDNASSQDNEFPMRVIPVECLRDNYAFIVVSNSGDAVVVDACETDPIRRALERERIRPSAIWSTHHHADHVGGNLDLSLEYSIPVVGHRSDEGRLPELSHPVDDGDIVRSGDVQARCLHVPGHTLGAVAYYLEDYSLVFTGDTLFSAGCGRLFEGTPELMCRSLARLASLPGRVNVYFGHEYTEDNLRFAAVLEPENPDVAAAQSRASRLRARGEPTLATTLDDELRTNPFLRLNSPAIRRAFPGSMASPEEVFAAVRSAKDRFR